MSEDWSPNSLCRLRTIPAWQPCLNDLRDPKGSELDCEEFLNFKGRLILSRPFFLEQDFGKRPHIFCVFRVVVAFQIIVFRSRGLMGTKL